MKYISSFDALLVATARDPQLGIDGCAHSGVTASKMGLKTIPAAAETVALARFIELAKESGCRLHISKLSTAGAVSMIRQAKDEGLAITADVGISHLFFGDQDIAGFDVNFHSEVPFRSAKDREALRQGVINGTIDAISSDHAPRDIDAGLAPFPSTTPGLSTYDWFLPMLLQLSEILPLSFDDLMHKASKAPEQILGISNTRFLLADIETARVCSEKQMQSAGKNSPIVDQNQNLEQLGFNTSLRGQALAMIDNCTMFEFDNSSKPNIA